jgi:hypothetical protein
MAFIHHQYGNNWNWDPVLGYPNQKVVFDAFKKIIYVNEGVTVLDVKIDIYSAWKEWLLSSPEFPYASSSKQAISGIGGEPLNDTLNVGSTFFLENGWRIQPFASGQPYILTVNGNIYTREAGGNPFLFAEGVSVNLTRSNLVDQLVASASITETDYNNIANKVWEYSQSVNTGSNSYGALTKGIDSDLTTVKVRIDKTLTTGEFLAFK